ATVVTMPSRGEVLLPDPDGLAVCRRGLGAATTVHKGHVTEHRELKQHIRAAPRAGPRRPRDRAGAANRPGEGEDEFGADQHRLSALAAHLLRQAGITAPHTGEPFSEAMACGLAGGIGWTRSTRRCSTRWPTSSTRRASTRSARPRCPVSYGIAVLV